MAKLEKVLKPNIFWKIVNVFLVFAVIFLLFYNFHKEKISFICSYNSNPANIVSFVGNQFPENTKKLKAIFFFNELPARKDLDMLNRVNKKFKNEVDLLTFFLKKFRQDAPFDFPYKFLSNKEIFCNKNGIFLKKNFFILLEDGKLQYVDFIPEAQILALLLNKKLENEIVNDFLRKEQLKTKLLKKLHQGPINLWNFVLNQIEPINVNGSQYEVYFYHSGCSSCELKKILFNAKVNELESEKKVIHIFLFNSNFNEISDIIIDNSPALNLYYDIDDCFELGFSFTGNIKNPIFVRFDCIGE